MSFRSSATTTAIWVAVLLLPPKFARAEPGQGCIERLLVPVHCEQSVVRSVTGRRIEIGRPLQVTQAWAGILTDRTGGPLKSVVMARHRAAHRTTRHQLLRDDRPGCDRKDRALLQRQTDVTTPWYFDLLLLATPATTQTGTLLLTIDYDLDRCVEDESLQSVRVAGSLQQLRSAARIQLHRTTGGWVARPVPAAARSEDAEPTSGGDDRWGDASEAGLHRTAVARLRALDAAAVRKQQLPRVVDAAAALIKQLDPTDQGQRRFLIEALYRRGRALGYQELPDVIQKFPVSNPADLQRRFESNFQHLARLVDTTAPRFILLSIRRERRRGCYGRALQLVERYRTTHPDPVWYHKKRFDLLHESSRGLAVHQAAADLWLHGRQPVPWTAPDPAE